MKVLHYLFFMGLFLLLTSFIIPKHTPISSIVLTTSDNIKTDGKDVIVRKGCTLCHHPEKKIVGPSFKEIAQKYEGNHAKLLSFLNGDSKPIVDPSEFQFMKSVLKQLKRTSKEDKEAMAKYILSLK